MPLPKPLRQIILWVLMMSSISAAAQNSTPKLYLFEDSSTSLSAESALQLFNKGSFTPAHDQAYNPGFTRSVFWLACVQDHELPADSVVLHIGDHHINRIFFYQVKDSVPQLLISTGDYYPFSQRPYNYPGFYFPVNQKAIYLARIDKSNESLQLVYGVSPLKEVNETEHRQAVVIALLTGMMLIMILFGIYLLIITREKIYFYYIAYLATGWLWVLANSGYGFEYIWYDVPWFASKARPVFAVMSGALSMFFLVNFVGAGQRLKRIVFWINVVMWLYVAIILSFNGHGYQTKAWMLVQYLIPAATLLYVLFVFYYLVRQSMKGNRYAQFYLVGASVLIATTLMQAMIQLGNLERFQYFFSHFGLGTGYVVESLILTAGLVYRFNQYRKDREKLLMEINRQQVENTRIMLEVQEAERSQVANQLHDVAGSLLSAARLNLSTGRDQIGADNSNNENLKKAEEAIVLVSDMVRNLSHALSPVMLEQVGLRTSLEKIAGIFNATGKVHVTLIVIGFNDYNAALTKYYLLLYGICYELLNNIVRHADATHALLQVTEHHEGFSIIAEDDGKGMSVSDTGKNSLGLAGIRSRLKHVGGEMALDQNKPSGLIVTIEIPLKSYDI